MYYKVCVGIMMYSGVLLGHIRYYHVSYINDHDYDDDEDEHEDANGDEDDDADDDDDIRRNDEMSTRAETFHTNQQK